MKIEAPLRLHNETVRPEWIDYNSHMNLAYYVLVFDQATDVFLDYIGMTEDFRRLNHASTFAAEMHVTYHKEVDVGDELDVSTQLLAYDAKRIHYFHRMHDKKDNCLVATNELMSLYMNMQKRRVASMPANIQQKLAEIQLAHSELSVPDQAGRVIHIKNKSA
jgi:acyl-CoA thioester hydrolase